MSRAPTVDEIQQHVAYELTWLIYTAHRHRTYAEARAAGRLNDGRGAVPMLTACLIHARNLVEFALGTGGDGLRMCHLGKGTSDVVRRSANDLMDFINHSTTHLHDRRGPRGAPWPSDERGCQIEPDDPRRLERIAGRVLTVLEARLHDVTMVKERAALATLLQRARQYLANPSRANHTLMQPGELPPELQFTTN